MNKATNRAGYWKLAFRYGSPAGFLVISLMVASYSIFGMTSNAAGQAVGFLLMFAFLSLIFFGIRSYRDKEQGGVIKFSRALGLGLAMSLFAGLTYVICWELYLMVTGTTFIDTYTAHLIDLEKAKGVSAAALEEFTQKMAKMKASYANPLYRMPITFSEIFPVGFIVSLVSALALHTPKLWARKI